MINTKNTVEQMQSPDDAIKAKEFGATGIGLCRTEHMFFCLIELINARMILANNKIDVV